MSATVAQVLELVNGIAPFELAEPWDNVGLLAGRPDAAVERVLCALDLRMNVLEEAVRKGAQLIVTHHPILFRGRKNLCETDAEGRLLCALARSGIAMIAAHTNFDNASPGVNDALAAALGLVLCGVEFAHPVGLLGHSDADVLTHALMSERRNKPTSVLFVRPRGRRWAVRPAATAIPPGRSDGWPCWAARERITRKLPGRPARTCT